MPGGNPPKPPLSSFSAQSNNRKTRWESSAASASAGPSTAHHKPTATPKPKPSPHPTATPPNNRDPNKQPHALKPNSRPENPSPRPENPNARPGPSHAFPFNDPPPPPAYGFHMLDRRSIVLADGSVRSYFALPPDYEKFPQMVRPGLSGLRPGFLGHHEFGLERPPFPMSPDFVGPDGRARNMGLESSLKRKFGEDERGGRDDGFERQRQQLLQYGNANGPGQGQGQGPGPSVGYNLGRGEELRAPKSMRYAEGSASKVKHSEVDQNALRKAFLHFVKLVFESANHKKSYLANKKQGPLPCLACGRSSKDFQDAHSLIMHAYNSDKADQLVDHLAFHKALCILMGWNYLMPPDNSKAYQNLSVDDAEATLNDLIIWPPTVLIHNTVTGKGKDGRTEGLGNRAMDSSLRELGFANGKSVSMYAREGHLGIHVVKFSADESGLMDALKMADFFARDKRGRKDWARVQPSSPGKDDEKNPNLVKLDPKTGDKTRVFYGHLATAADLEKITFEVKKKVSIVSLREFRQSR